MSELDASQQKRAALTDVALVLLAIVVAWLLTRWVIYPSLHVPDNAPMILRPIAGFFTAWWLLRRRGQGFQRVGMRMPSSPLRAVLGAIALYFVMQAISEYVVPILGELLHAESRPSFMRYIRGNLVAFLGWLAIGTLVGGFSEELLFRGFLLTRVAEGVGGGRVGVFVGVVAQALLFGVLHFYGGPFAFVHATVFALVSGAFYLILDRNLWPLIVVHAAWNAIGIWGVYSS